MREHLDTIIEVESVREIYQTFWENADQGTVDSMARAAMSEERGTDDCSYFDWHRELGADDPSQ